MKGTDRTEKAKRAVFGSGSKARRTTSEREHWQKYEDYAQKIGIDSLCGLVPFTKAEIIKALRTDEYMNNLRLHQWDLQHDHVYRLARNRGIKGLSESNSVSLLKHVAKYHIVSDSERPETVHVEEPYVPPEREEPSATIDECIEEAAVDIMGRCANIPRAYLKDAIEVHEGLLRDVRLLLLNDQDLYYDGPHSPKWRQTAREIIEYSYYWCEKAFKPNAEDEIKELQTPTGDKARDLANALWVPFMEQFLEIPRDERIAMTDECKRTVKFTLQDLETCLKARWPKESIP